MIHQLKQNLYKKAKLFEIHNDKHFKFLKQNVSLCPIYWQVLLLVWDIGDPISASLYKSFPDVGCELCSLL